ncbi:MAG: Secretion system C-terminal sorting domain [Bacteroidota bacterium]
MRYAFQDEVVGDTVAGGNTYQIVRRTGSMYSGFGFGYVYDTLDGTYYYRVQGNKVIVLDTVLSGNAQEGLLYEFGLSLGDTATEPVKNLLNLTLGGRNGVYWKMFSYDTVCVQNWIACDSNFILSENPGFAPWFLPGSRWDPWQTITFLNDIGTIHSYPYVVTLDVAGQYYLLKQLTSNGQVLFRHPATVVGVDGATDEIRIQVFPNPASEKVHIQSDMPLERLELRDAFGRTVDRWTIAGNSAILDVRNLPRGFYWIAILNSERPSIQKLTLH